MTLRIPPDVQERLRQLNEMELSERRLRDRLTNMRQVPEANPTALRRIFSDMVKHYSDEEDVLSFVLGRLDEVVQHGSRVAQTKTQTQDFFPPRSRVVVRLMSNARTKPQWILANVLGYNVRSKKYELVDADPEETQSMKIHRKWVHRLPINWDSRAIVVVGERVMALYPETTSFYAAEVKREPQVPTDQVAVLFDDEESANEILGLLGLLYCSPLQYHGKM